MLGRVLLCLFVLEVVGCAQGSITILSQPEGAYITIGGQGVGTAPVQRTILNNGAWVKDASGCYLIPEVKAQWASGATDVQRNRLCNGLRAQYTVLLNRPANAPGLNQDLAIANQQAASRAQQRQANAQSDMAAIQMINTMQQQQYMQQQQIRANQPAYTNCSRSGNSVQCYTY